MKQVLLLTLMINIFSIGRSQVAINSTGGNPASSAMLDISSTDKGVLISRMNSAQRKAIVNPATGLLVFDTDRLTLYMFDGMEWRPLAFTVENGLNAIQRTSPSGYGGSKFGQSVAIHGNYAVVGAPYDTAGGVSSGAAYIYRKEADGWKLQAKLSASNKALLDEFGYSVDIYNDLVAIGAPGKAIGSDTKKGRAYIFQREGDIWVQKVGLLASDGVAGDHFGFSVTLYNQSLIVGAPYADHSGFVDNGSAYVFKLENNTWTQKARLNGPSSADYFAFGFDMDLHGNNLVVGAPGFTNFSSGGQAYLYNISNLGGVVTVAGQTLGASPYNQNKMRFGHSVAISATQILVGAPEYDSPNMLNNGAWFIFKPGAGGVWAMTNNYGGDEPNAHEGYSVSLDGEDCYVGSPYWSSYRGRIVVKTVFNRYVYNVDQTIAAQYGLDIAAHNGHYIVGAPSVQGPAVHIGIK